MTRLLAKTPLAGLLPLDIGSVTVTEPAPAPLTLIAPFAGQGGAVAGALGQPLPDPGRFADTSPRLIWWGHAGYMRLAPPPELGGAAAVTDQSDGWARVRIGGDDAEETLARLVPVDLSVRSFPEGSVARTLLGHMPVAILRDAGGFEIWAFRSMADSLVHDLTRAMRQVASRRTRP